MKILVTIVNYGTKNNKHLHSLIQEYRSMPFSVDITIVSNVLKDFGPAIPVVVGLPARNPWSLPFNHKKVLGSNVDNYDLFIYSEDDTLITEEHIRSFLRITEVLPEDEITGFMRYELDNSNQKTISTIHSGYHWEPNSVKTIGEYTFARLTNDHSACYILTQKQLKKAIASGKYLVAPHKGRYDFICTAATDPYTQCGFKKVVCISHIDEFLIHHMPDNYVGKYGIKYEEMKKQIDYLLTINNDMKSKSILYNGEVNIPSVTWNKPYYEPTDDRLVALIPDTAKTVLSVGCGSGNAEAKISALGKRVICVPMDDVMSVLIKDKGMEVVPSNFSEAYAALSKERFDVILLVDVLQFQREPTQVLREFAQLLGHDGRVIVRVPNFHYLGTIKDFILNKEPRKSYKNDFAKNKIHMTTLGMVKKWMKDGGLKHILIEHDIAKAYQIYSKMLLDIFRTNFASRLYIVAKK